ncbi:MAG: hypothetical protein ACRDT8_22015 [Micromonosporaceae bacterium]
MPYHQRVIRFLVAALAFVLVAAGGVAGPASPAAAHGGSDYVPLYNPIDDGGGHNTTTAWWAWGYEVSPPGHHIVFSNWGIMNDWSMDIFAGASWKPVVTPFGYQTTAGHGVSNHVVGIGPTCASGNIDDGGYRITIEARDTVTGEVLARADLGHLISPQVWVGQQIGGWTVIGYTHRFRYSSCYQVSSDSGIHVHFEVINQHRYACYDGHGYNTPLTPLTRIGAAATHYDWQRAQC